MATPAVSVAELPTADENPEAWNVIWIAGLPCPGICLPLDGERRRAVEHKKSKGSSKDILVDQGLDPTEVSVRIKTTDPDTFRSLYDFYRTYMDPDRILSRLTVVSVAHPQLYARGIKQGYFFSAPLPKPTAETGIRPYISEFRFKIVGPKTQIVGTSTSTKPKYVTVNVPSNFKPQYGVVNAVSAIPIFNLPDPSAKFGPPSPNDIKVYDPITSQQIGFNGDATLTFVNTQVAAAAPR